MSGKCARLRGCNLKQQACACTHESKSLWEKKKITNIYVKWPVVINAWKEGAWACKSMYYSHLQLYCRQRILLLLCLGPKDSLYLYGSVLAGNGGPFSKSFRGHINIFDVLHNYHSFSFKRSIYGTNWNLPLCIIYPLQCSPVFFLKTLILESIDMSWMKKTPCKRIYMGKSC